MSIVVDAVYQDGVLKPEFPLPLKDHEKVRVTVEPAIGRHFPRVVIPCSDAELIERIALDKDLEYEP